jgi:hypothetical protein
VSPTASNSIPLFPPKSIQSRLEHFDDPAFDIAPTTIIYKIVDALCGDAGAGDLKKESMIDRLGENLDTLYFNDLDRVFSSMGFLTRSESETYPYDPEKDMLTSDQWDEVRVKDAWYRARVRDFMIAADHGGTPEGLMRAVVAGSSVGCDIYEVWRYIDNFGITPEKGTMLGRSPVSSRSEVVLVPHKERLGNKEFRLLRQMLNRISPVDAIITVDLRGLAVHDPIVVKKIAADSSYFEVQKEVTLSPDLENLPPPEVLAIDIRPSENWLSIGKGNPEIAPYAAFNITQEYGYYYLMSGGARSPIDSVEYSSRDAAGNEKQERAFEDYEILENFTAWMEYDKADSPDNYPGGKFGLTPTEAPAVSPNGNPYVFPYQSQAQYIAEVREQVGQQGGQSDEVKFRLPVVARSTTKKTYTPDLAVAWTPPVRDSSVTSSWMSNRALANEVLQGEWRISVGMRKN